LSEMIKDESSACGNSCPDRITKNIIPV